jgi:hypothetical protein
MGLRAGLEKGKVPYPCRGSNLGRPVRSLSLYRLSYAGSLKIQSTICKIKPKDPKPLTYAPLTGLYRAAVQSNKLHPKRRDK